MLLFTLEQAAQSCSSEKEKQRESKSERGIQSICPVTLNLRLSGESRLSLLWCLPMRGLSFPLVTLPSPPVSLGFSHSLSRDSLGLAKVYVSESTFYMRPLWNIPYDFGGKPLSFRGVHSLVTDFIDYIWMRKCRNKIALKLFESTLIQMKVKPEVILYF